MATYQDLLPLDILKETLDKASWETVYQYCRDPRLKTYCQKIWKQKLQREFGQNLDQDRLYQDDFYEYLRRRYLALGDQFPRVSQKEKEEILKEQERISRPIVNYLHDRYPNEFRLIIQKLTEEEFRNLRPSYEALTWNPGYDDIRERMVRKYKLKPNDVFVGLFPDDESKVRIIIHINDSNLRSSTGSSERFGRMNDLSPLGNFYNQMNSLGIFPKYINSLYNTEQDGAHIWTIY